MFFSLKGPRQPTYIDRKIGWRATENYYYEGEKIDAAGKRYPVRITTNKNGFKLFGDLHSKKERVFIIGDSFTQGEEVSNDKTYYGNLANKIKSLEFFVYGCGGYGSLQEFMILDEFINTINPQILIIQLSSNDFINNDYILEKESFINNNALRRPYIDLHGNVFYKNPAHFSLVPDILGDYSRLLYFINDRVNRILTRFFIKTTIEVIIEGKGSQHQGFRHSADITKKIMDMIRNKTPNITVYTFCADDLQPYYDEFRNLSEIEGFKFIEGVPQAIKVYEEKGFTTKAEDHAHWNELGHKIAGDKLQEYFSTNGFIR